MHLYIVRHGIAEDHSPTGRDEDRALTEEGREKMKEEARGLKRLEPAVEHIFSSPLVRARQTAEIIGAELKMKIDLLKVLAPGHSPAEVCDALKPYKNKASGIVVAGHEPDCSELVSYLLDSPRAINVDFKKGAICLVETASLDMGSGCLIWHLSPKALRLMAD